MTSRRWLATASYGVLLVSLSGASHAQVPSVDPALLQRSLEMLKQQEATLKANPTLPARAAVWEAGAGYIMNLTITMRGMRDQGGREGAQVRSNIVMRYTASIPMNYGTPAVLPMLGPQWSLLAARGAGHPEAEARPITMALEWEEQSDVHIAAGCTGTDAATTDTHIVAKGKAGATGPIPLPAGQGYAQALMQINGLLTSYSFVGGATFSNQADIVTTSRTVDHCASDRVTNDTKNTRTPVGNLGDFGVDIKDVPLPPNPQGLKGSRTMPRRFNNWDQPATIEWNIAPIPAR